MDAVAARAHICLQRGVFWCKILFAAVLLFSLVQAVPAQDRGAYIQKTEQGQINWLSGEVSASGTAESVPFRDEEAGQKIMLRQARLKAQRHLYTTLKKIRINSSMTLEDLVANNSKLRRRLRGWVQNAELAGTTDPEGEEVSVSLRVKLWGTLSKMLIPDSVWYNQPQRSGSGEEEDGKQEQEASRRAEEYTGLVVDARGLDVEPSLVCRVLGPEGELIYGPGVVPPSIAIGRGMAGYMQDIDRAKASSRTGDSPLIVRAREQASSNGCEITLSSEARKELGPEPWSLKYLRRGKLVFVLGSVDGDQPLEYRLNR